MDTWDENLVILYWFYVKSCIFVHIIDKFFGDRLPIGDLWPPLAPGNPGVFWSADKSKFHGSIFLIASS